MSNHVIETSAELREQSNVGNAILHSVDNGTIVLFDIVQGKTSLIGLMRDYRAKKTVFGLAKNSK